jgi:outer membrane lipoprotein SlyB
VESIRKLQYHRPSDFWTGAFYGSAAGALAGTFISATGQESAAPTAGILGAVGGLVVGGFVADYCSRDDRYDLSPFDVPAKKTILTTILLQSSLHVKEDKPQ